MASKDKDLGNGGSEKQPVTGQEVPVSGEPRAEVVLDITAEDIAEAITAKEAGASRSRNCPVSLAAKRHFGAEVTSASGWVFGGPTEDMLTENSEPLCLFQNDFDDGEPVEPATFTLTLTREGRAAIKKQKGDVS